MAPTRKASPAKPAARRRTAASEDAPVRRSPVKRGRPAASAHSPNPRSRKTDLTAYADKPATEYHKAFARWLVQTTGWRPSQADSSAQAFLKGVALSSVLRTEFMGSEYLAAWREENGFTKRGPKTAPVEDEPETSDDDFEDDESDDEEDSEFEDDSNDEDDEDSDEDEFDDESDDEDESDDDEDEFEDDEPPAPKTRKPAGRKAAPAKRQTPAKPTAKAAAPARRTPARKAAPKPAAAPKTRRAKPAAADGEDFIF